MFVDDLLAHCQTKVNEYDRKTCAVVKKKKFESDGQKGRKPPREIREIYPRTGDVEAGEESTQFESYVCKVIPLSKYFVASKATYRELIYDISLQNFFLQIRRLQELNIS